MRDFNTAGPVRAHLHYCVPPLDRVKLSEVVSLVRVQRYFVLHAPRQTGKTSVLMALRDLLNGGSVGEYRCGYLNVEPAQTAREDVGQAMGAIATEIAREARNTLNDPATAEAADRLDTTRRPDGALGTLLDIWTRADKAPLVVLIDEIDSLVGDTLVSVLRQLRAGYAHRPESFPQSVVLCGVRDVRGWGSTRPRRDRSSRPGRWRPCGSRHADSPGSTARSGRWGRAETLCAHEIPHLSGQLTRLSGNDPLVPCILWRLSG